MKRFVAGEDRSQSTLFPEVLDDYIAEDNPVRAIDVFIDELDLHQLGFEGIRPEATGRPAYHPATLLKIYLYGYLNRLQSSRHLERETQRNVELIWLTGKLMPDFKTIADFRCDNGPAIRNVCREFIELCRGLGLFAEAIVAIDGSKFKAVNNRDKNFTDRKLQARREQLEESIARYLADLDRADREPTVVTEDRVSRLKEKIERIKAQWQHLDEIGRQMQQAPDGQVSLTDPDARSMATSGWGTGIVGYNVQTAVDAKHHLIVAHEVTNVGHDRNQLAAMAKQARAATGAENLVVLADRGYFSGTEGRFDKRDFVYLPERDEFRCPAGEQAIRRFTRIEHGMVLHRYWSSACPKCAIKAQCTPADYRRITCWEHEAVLDRMQARLDRTPEASRWRRQTAEHPFATLKAWMGTTHFLTKTLPRVSTEMSLQVLAYNFKRVMKILGSGPLMQAMRT